MKNKELVLCISKLYFDSLKEVKVKNKEELSVQDIFDLMDFTGIFRERGTVEYDNNFLQIIPYTVAIHNNKVYATHRLAGDERLQGKVGYLGGHVNSCDIEGNINFKKIINKCIQREMQEETNIAKGFRNNILTYFYDDTNDVSKVHLCLLVVAELDDKQAKKLAIKEKDKLAGQWYTLEEINDLYKQGFVENWCKIATDLLVENNLLSENKVAKENKTDKEEIE